MLSLCWGSPRWHREKENIRLRVSNLLLIIVITPNHMISELYTSNLTILFFNNEKNGNCILPGKTRWRKWLWNRSMNLSLFRDIRIHLFFKRKNHTLPLSCAGHWGVISTNEHIDIIWEYIWLRLSFQFISVSQSCLTLCDPMDSSTPGFPVHHQLLELAQTYVHLGDAIQSSNPLLSPSPAFNLSQHQRLF